MALGPKAKLQQVMMNVAQKVPFEIVVLDGPSGGFADAAETARALAGAVEKIPGLDKSKLLVFRRLAVGLARHGRGAPDGGRAFRHHRPVPGRG